MFSLVRKGKEEEGDCLAKSIEVCAWNTKAPKPSTKAFWVKTKSINLEILVVHMAHVFAQFPSLFSVEEEEMRNM